MGNNVLQIIRAIHYGKINNYNCLHFINRNFSNGKQTTIILNDEKNDNQDIYDSFFNIKNMGCSDPNPQLMKKYFQKYLKETFVYKNINRASNANILHIHIRAGDIFQGSGAHPAYVQPPLKYYKDIIESQKWGKIIVVYEDHGNPCVNALKNLEVSNMKFTSDTLVNDIGVLCQSENLVLGFGTFGLLLFFLNQNIKQIYIPKYVIEELPKGNWGDVRINIIDLPNYIKCGEWKNTIQQKIYMLDYN